MSDPPVIFSPRWWRIMWLLVREARRRPRVKLTSEQQEQRRQERLEWIREQGWGVEVDEFPKDEP